MNIQEWDSLSLFQWQACPGLVSLQGTLKTRSSCSCKGTKISCVGTLDGHILVFNNKLELLADFVACEGGVTQQLELTNNQSALCCVCLDRQNAILIQFWSIRNIHKRTSKDITCLYERRLYGIPNPLIPATSIAISADVSSVFCGFANGILIQLQGDFLRDLGSKQDVVFRERDSITDLAILSPRKLSVSTTTQTFVYNIITKSVNILENNGLAIGCSEVYMQRSLLCANLSFISVYELKTLSLLKTFHVEGTIRRIFTCFGHVCLLVSTTPTLSSRDHSEIISEDTSLWFFILDLESQLILFQFEIEEKSISNILYTSDDCFFFYDNCPPQQLIRLPQDFLLYKCYEKEEFEKSYLLANYLKCTEDIVRDCALRTGLLYFKGGNFEKAIDYFIYAIPFSDSALIIKTYLEHRLLRCLLRYLEALAAEGHAYSFEQSTLIFLYIKFRKFDSLMTYAKSGSCSTELLLPILRKYKCFDQMEALGKIWNMPLVCLEVYQAKELKEKAFQLLENCHDYIDVIEISNHYGTWFINSDPSKFTEKMVKVSLSLLNLRKEKNLIMFLKSVYLSTYVQHPDLQMRLWDAIKLQTIEPMVLKFVNTRKLHSLIQREMDDVSSKNETEAILLIKDCNSLLDYESSILSLQSVRWSNALDLLYSQKSLISGSNDTIIQKLLKDPNTADHLIDRYDDEAILQLLRFLVRERSVANLREDLFFKVLESSFIQFEIPIQHLLDILMKDQALTLGTVKRILLKWETHCSSRIKENDRQYTHLQKELASNQSQLNFIPIEDQLCDNCEGVLKIPFNTYSCLHIVHRDCASESICAKCKSGVLETPPTNYEKHTSSFHELFSQLSLLESFML
ncbi:ubiquitin-protein ligase E3 involved in vesicle docking Pep5/Vps11-like [Schizosaccharomyces osmophilus]|uniref:Ubiquitin-protein ligase E3 involved in vesicle docking Pep5/Vps11-like n=1 Tax=Schizosaccharomyces osmophilus TaxID=2545709 RepID=A0AAE9W9G8_9SCHI|nr:ubiquitin-protein ligase E3 involved in vesicle docking Pep5/Vps11-like [Schizosaccharomyces osmophilus]WBW71800.1 ubiquitin-protein ligase E3 involved in vesicle docking Pep5/Vps11-like [Schizosaccharomyces osmophilus]